MHGGRFGIIIVLLSVCAIFISGCTQQPAIPGCSLVPGPTETVPSYQSVYIEVMKNPISTNPYIVTTFAGGKGLGRIIEMTTTVIRSDCAIETGSVYHPPMGANITLMGTTGTDRVIVKVTMIDGITYTVVDQDLPFPAKINLPQ